MQSYVLTKFLLSFFLEYVSSGVASIWCQGGTTIEAPKMRASRRRVGGYAEGCPLPSRLEGLGERHELPQRGRGSPGRYRIFCNFRPQNASGSKKIANSTF